MVQKKLQLKRISGCIKSKSSEEKQILFGNSPNQTKANMHFCPKQHWPDQCDVPIETDKTKEYLRKNGLCFKCGDKHLVKHCKRRGCYCCKGAHHSSIHEERTGRTADTARELDVREQITGYTSTNDRVMPLVPFPVKDMTSGEF